MLHSSQNVQGGNLKHLFIIQESRELDFLVEQITDTEFHLYIYRTADAQDGAVGVTKIQVYMTILLKENDEWYGKESQFGYAVIGYFPGTNILSIDVETWER